MAREQRSSPDHRFCKNARDSSASEAFAVEGNASSASTAGGDSAAEEPAAASSSKLNMASGFVHALADLMRTVAQLAAATLVLSGEVEDAAVVDAACSLFACAFVFLAVLGLLRKIWQQVQTQTCPWPS